MTIIDVFNLRNASIVKIIVPIKLIILNIVDSSSKKLQIKGIRIKRIKINSKTILSNKSNIGLFVSKINFDFAIELIFFFSKYLSIFRPFESYLFFSSVDKN